MASNVRLINVTDWTGGLNLRADAFQLGENESPDMLNVEVDPRGGVSTRKSWTDWQTLTLGELEVWDPRTLYSHVKGDGTEVLFLVNGSDLWIRVQGGSFVKQAGIVCSGDPHGADFASWLDDVYFTCGRAQQSYRWNGASNTLTALDDPSDGVGTGWTTDPLTPTADTMPQAEFVCVHNGYLWAANTEENGSNAPHRVRFSLPNDPDAWQELDYILIPDGGGPITGIMPLRDQLLVFTARSVHAILGYDLNSFSVVDVIGTVGAANRQCVTRAEGAVYFASWPQGVHRVSLDSVDEVSVSLRPAIQSSNFSPNTDLQWLSWAGQKLYWSVPYDEDGAPVGTRTVFVFDPSMESWTKHRSGCGCGVAPIINSAQLSAPIGTTRFGPSVLNLWGEDTGIDTVTGDTFPIPAHFRTRWFDAGLPTIKKRWRRPDIVADEDDTPYEMTIYVYHDFDQSNAKRTKTFTVSAEGAGGVWYADPDWDGTDGSLLTPPVGVPIWSETPDDDDAGWGVSPEGGSIERASSLGSARAVQLEFRGEAGRRWGINALVLKFLLRRIR